MSSRPRFFFFWLVRGQLRDRGPKLAKLVYKYNNKNLWGIVTSITSWFIATTTRVWTSLIEVTWVSSRFHWDECINLTTDTLGPRDFQRPKPDPKPASTSKNPGNMRKTQEQNKTNGTFFPYQQHVFDGFDHTDASKSSNEQMHCRGGHNRLDQGNMYRKRYASVHQIYGYGSKLWYLMKPEISEIACRWIFFSETSEPSGLS